MDRGEVIADRYRLERPIGEGNMGVVWLATDLRLHRTVALKQGNRMRREGIGGAKLMHPHAIAVFDVVGDSAGREWLVMEYLPGRSLAVVLREDGPLPPARVAAIGTQIASALAHLHQKGIVHRDITPGNVLVTPDGTAKLTDFGIATWESVTQTEDPKIGGTPGFQAPEVVRGNRATSASDVYSLGATLAAAVEGHPSPDARADAPLGTVLAALLERDPPRRPTAEQAQRMLLELADPKMRRRWWVSAAAVVVVLAVLTLWWVDPFEDRDAGTAVPSAPARTGSDASGAAALSASLVGDPHTADPCALTHADALSRFGEVGASDNYGNFDRCDAFVYLSEDQEDFVDLDVELDVGGPASGVPVQRVGRIGVQRPPAEDDCTRILLLPQEYRVVISARKTGREQADLCSMAEAVSARALDTLNAGQIPRRVLPPESLAAKNACQLLDTDTITRLLGAGTVRREAGFADWECDWSYPESTEIKVVFDRTNADSAGDGTAVKLAGYPAFVEPQGYGDTDCLVSIVYRDYVDTGGERTDELVLVDVDDSDKKPQQLCAPAQRLATTVAQRLSS